MTPRAAADEVYGIRTVDSPSQIDAGQWNGLLARQPSPTPFLRLEYLKALEESGSATAATGWRFQGVLVENGDGLQAACALYAKAHSYGEYVFDWAWADAYRRHGLRYYPKLLAAVPFTPVPGTRLLARDAAARSRLAVALLEHARAGRLSSAHVLFVDDADREALADAGWMIRRGVQFHWVRDEDDPAPDFNALLARMQRDKRKKIQQERRRVAEQGVTFRALHGREIGEADWDFFYRCYTLTYEAHHSTPYLTRAFFHRMSAAMPEHWLMFVAERDGRAVASSLVAVDAARGAAWGRYWGSVEPLPFVHFEACYYQPLAWCLANGYRRFEGGAQGEHKMARGLLPTPTASAHWLRDPRFSRAVADFLASESEGLSEYVDELRERNPFKTTP